MNTIMMLSRIIICMIICSLCIDLTSANRGVISYDDMWWLLDAQVSSATIDQKILQLCTWTDQWDSYIIAARCLTQNQLPTLWFEESIEYLRPHVQLFDTTYDIGRASFEYRWDSPDLYHEFSQRSSWRYHLHWDDVLRTLSTQDISIILPKDILASRQTDGYFFGATPRRLAWWRCTQTNYLVAVSSLDRLLLMPGATLNLNRRIEYLPGYCKGKGDTWLMFFGGVCGVSSQLFRGTMLSEMLTVLQRHPHSQRYTQYYTDDVWWDDAAIYQMSKQFEIRNDSDQPVLFRTVQYQDIMYLVTISPTIPPTYTSIQKQQLWPRSSTVTKSIYNRLNHDLINTISRSSVYTAINTSRF